MLNEKTNLFQRDRLFYWKPFDFRTICFQIFSWFSLTSSLFLSKTVRTFARLNNQFLVLLKTLWFPNYLLSNLLVDSLLPWVCFYQKQFARLNNQFLFPSYRMELSFDRTKRLWLCLCTAGHKWLCTREEAYSNGGMLEKQKHIIKPKNVDFSANLKTKSSGPLLH